MSDTLTIREGLNGASVPDAWLASDAPTANYGGSTTLRIGFATGKTNVSTRAVMSFDVSALPAGAVVLDAVLRLHCSAPAASGEWAAIHRLTQPAWTQSGATWIRYDAARNWNTAGGDYAAGVEAASTLPTTVGTWQWQGLKRIVNDAIANRGGIVHLLLRRTIESNASATAHVNSGEHGREATKPTLVITYDGGAARVGAASRGGEMNGPILRKYGTAATIDFQLYEADGVSFRADAVHASGDTKIMKDEGSESNTSNGFVDRGRGYSIALTATEMQAARIVVYVVDQTAPKAWLDAALVIETYGHASAMHPFDLGSASPLVGLTSSALAAVADAVLDENTSQHATAGSLGAEVHLSKAMLANNRLHAISTGVDRIMNDDGVSLLRTMTPVDGGEDEIEVVAS